MKQGSRTFCQSDGLVLWQSKILPHFLIPPCMQYRPAQNVPAAKNHTQSTSKNKVSNLFCQKQHSQCSLTSHLFRQETAREMLRTPRKFFSHIWRCFRRYFNQRTVLIMHYCRNSRAIVWKLTIWLAVEECRTSVTRPSCSSRRSWCLWTKKRCTCITNISHKWLTRCCSQIWWDKTGNITGIMQQREQFPMTRAINCTYSSFVFFETFKMWLPSLPLE